MLPIVGPGSLLAALLAYAAENVATESRGRAVGLAAATSRVGGVPVIACVAAALAPPSVPQTAILGAAPLVIGTAWFALTRVETRRRPLEDICGPVESPATVNAESSSGRPGRPPRDRRRA